MVKNLRENSLKLQRHLVWHFESSNRKNTTTIYFFSLEKNRNSNHILYKNIIFSVHLKKFHNFGSESHFTHIF